MPPLVGQKILDGDESGLLEESLDLAYHAARAEDQTFNVTLERNLAPDIGELDVYPADLRRVFLNLTGNAFYAVRARAAGGGDGSRPAGVDRGPWK